MERDLARSHLFEAARAYVDVKPVVARVGLRGMDSQQAPGLLAVVRAREKLWPVVFNENLVDSEAAEDGVFG